MSASRKKEGSSRSIRVGIGGWVYAPWRGGVFYPDDLTQKDELPFASRQVSTIEINGTFYGAQKPSSFEAWHDATPEDFVFAVKGPRYATHRRNLAESASSIERFFDSGVTLLKAKLGPINWQFSDTKTFDADDFRTFLKLLPRQLDGLSLRHAVEVRHESFNVPAFLALLREFDVAVVMSDKPGVPHFQEVTAPFVYVRLQHAQERYKAGYAPAALDRWAERAATWATQVTSGSSRNAAEVFIYMINGFKEKAPAAAIALAGRIKRLA